MESIDLRVVVFLGYTLYCNAYILAIMSFVFHVYIVRPLRIVTVLRNESRPVVTNMRRNLGHIA